MAAKDSEMSFWDHLEALRGTLFRSVAAIGLCSIVFLAIDFKHKRRQIAASAPELEARKLAMENAAPQGGEP